MDNIFKIAPPVLRVPDLQQIWRKHRPDVFPLFYALSQDEPWIVPATREDASFPDQMSQALVQVSEQQEPTEDLLRELVEVLAYFGAEQAVYAIAWLNEHSEHGPRLMRYLLDHQDDGTANAVLYRIRMVARHQVLNDLVSAAESPLNRLSA